MVDIQSATAEIRPGKKKKIEERWKKPQDRNIMSASATQYGHKNSNNNNNNNITICKNSSNNNTYLY